MLLPWDNPFAWNDLHAWEDLLYWIVPIIGGVFVLLYYLHLRKI